jgi:ABC-type phosphate/phosphonate transport system substrate-binding protein
VSWVPPGLDWSEDVHDSWRDPSCVLSHACGWPVAALLTDQVRVAGAFSLALPDAEGHRYRSVILANRPGAPDTFARPETVVAANSRDSLSGWVSLVAGLVGAGQKWPGEVVWTGAHSTSLRLLRAGEVDGACIDSWTLAHLLRIDPGAAAGLHEIGRGPWIPSPAVVLRADATDEQLGELRRGFADVLADPTLAEVRTQLMIDGFVELDDDHYRPLIDLTPVE